MADKKLYVQAGKSCTSKKGLLTEGTEVLESDFVGRKASIDGLVKAEVIGEKKAKKEVAKKEVPTGAQK